MSKMFKKSLFEGDLSNWKPKSLKWMGEMFYKSNFSGNIDNWDVSNVEKAAYAFDGSPLENKKPKWWSNKINVS
jgi:hypothetical protein